LIQLARFRPLRYNPEAISFISRVVAPPYDLIDEREAEELRQRDPHNVIHLILGKAGPEGRSDAEYESAAETLRRWCGEGVLFLESVPAVYVCEQSFELRGQQYTRRGLLTALLLEEPASGNMLPHEQTTAGAKADRLRLMEACRAQLSPVFGVFSDSGARVDALLGRMCGGELIYEFQTADEIACRIWRVTDSQQISDLAVLLANENLLIADGHHRYETALAYRQKHRSADGPRGAAPEDFLLVFGVSTRNSGLAVLPTHRLARAGAAFDADDLLRRLQKHFNVRKLHVECPGDLQEVVAEWETTEETIGCYLAGGRLVLLQTSDNRLPDAALPPPDEEGRRLPVAILHYGVLAPLFDLAADMRTDSARLRYEPDVDQMYWGVESGRFDVGFLLPPLDPPTLEKYARSGYTMPPKTTYFYPKVSSGLLFYPLGERASAPCLVSP
jgi:uncharacterized protein (DUF1015 family)